MSTVFKILFLLILLFNFNFAQELSGEKVFKTYCWGCHHQTATAFGPSFESIANKRTQGEIQGHILAPKSTFAQLGYKRSVMPSFANKLSQEELNSISEFILSFKTKETK